MEREIARINREAQACVIRNGLRNEISIQELDHLFQANFVRMDNFLKRTWEEEKCMFKTDQNNNNKEVKEDNNNIVRVKNHTKVLTPVTRTPTFEVSSKPLAISCVAIKKDIGKKKCLPARPRTSIQTPPEKKSKTIILREKMIQEIERRKPKKLAAEPKTEKKIC